MKVLKFGGSSVASSENINKVIAIVKESSLQNNVAVVVSALGGVTDLLLEAGNLACKGDSSYLNSFKIIEEKHLQVIRELIPVNNQSGVLGQIKKMLNKLENTLEGVFLINELSPKTSDKLVSFGELFSSFIIYILYICIFAISPYFRTVPSARVMVWPLKLMVPRLLTVVAWLSAVRFHTEPAPMKMSALVLYFSPPCAFGMMVMAPVHTELFLRVRLTSEIVSTTISPFSVSSSAISSTWPPLAPGVPQP